MRPGSIAASVLLVLACGGAAPQDSSSAGASARPVGSTRWRHGDALWGMASAGDGRVVYVSGRDLHVRGVDTTTGETTLDVVVGEWSATALAVSPDGRWIASGDRSKIHLLDSAGVLVRTLTVQGNYMADAAFSPDSAKLVVVSDDELSLDGDQRVFLVDVGSGRVKTLVDPMTDSKSEVTAVAWSPDGASFYTGSEWGDLQVWRADGTHVRGVELPGATEDLAVGRDGTV